ncbi:MAG: CpsD/CapB family tyrosine-protein kinase [Wenzhouxiangella sp.]
MNPERSAKRRASGSNHGPKGDDHASIGPGRTISRMDESRALSPGALEQQRLIHARMRDFRQVDLFRELRTNVLRHATCRNAVVLVTGVSRRCGTSFLARNLAASIAFDEERTALLMDCNLRHSTVAEDFFLPSDGPGLIDLFGNNTDKDLGHVIYSSGVPRLRLVPAGRSERQSVEYFASVRMRGLIQEARSRYDDRCLVIDAPPALGTPDARILSEYADVVVLVAGEGRHQADTVRRAAAVFPPERLAGVIFNHLP